MANTGMSARGQNYRGALAIQADDHTPNTTSSNFWEYSMTAGVPMSMNTEAEIAISDSDDQSAGYFISEASGGGDFTVLSDPTSVGTLWKAHLGAESVATKAHTFTKTDVPLFVTGVFKRPDVAGGTDRWEQFSNAFVKTLKVSHKAGQLLEHAVTLDANSTTFNITAPVPVAGTAADGLAGDYRQRSPRILTPNKLLTAIGSTLKLDLDATPATTVIHNPESIDIESSFSNFKWIQTDALNPSSYWTKGAYSVTATVSHVFTSFDSYAQTFYGSKTVTADMAQSATMVYGTCDFTWPIVAGTASYTLQVKLLNMRWRVALASVQPNGDAVRVVLTGRGLGTTTPVSVVATGDRATTAYTNSA